MIRLVVVGAAGRMGRAVLETAAHDPGFEIKACVDRVVPEAAGGFRWLGQPGEAVGSGDVVVEFSSPAGAVEVAALCAGRGAALVSGTTSLSAEEEAQMRRFSEQIPVLRAANFSLGMLALRRALAAALPAVEGWDIEIVERHHRGKQDSPSGTALQLARDAAALRGDAGIPLRHGREGRVGTRPAREIGIHALRGGSWVGDHAVVLAGPGEWVELKHVAQDRAAFAQGALTAARFVSTAAPGFYTLDAVLGVAARGAAIIS